MYPQMGPPPDPETMITMLQNPQFASTLNEALQNPQILDMMINQNPQLRSMGPEVRQMMQTPEFRRMMTDPEQLRNMTRLGRMFGAGGLPGMPGSTSTSAFPAPGNTDEAAGEGAEGNRAPTQPPLNPLASLFGMPFNPAAFGVPPPPAGTPATTTGTTRSSSRGATPSTDRSSTPSQQPPTPQQPTNPFTAANPFLANPALMQQMLQAMNTNATAGSNPYEAIFGPHGLLGGAPGAGAAGAGGAGAGGAFGGLPGFGWGNLGAGAPAEQAPVVQDTRPPEERYEQQLRQLNEMGFYEFERNVEALRRTGGSVEGAVEYLLTH
jgi:ubiquilin